MDSENVFKIPSVPSTPNKVLSQMSPDRMNQQRIPLSPSLPGHLSDLDQKLQSPHRQQQRNSDVRSIAEQWERISHIGATPPASPTRLAGTTHAALQRAILGREEAEAQLAEASVRERKISERLESLMEELGEVRTKLAHNKEIYNRNMKELKREGFKADSRRLMVEDELKEARAQCGRWKAEADRERNDKEKANQEAFERAYAVAGLTEEMESLKEIVRSYKKDKEGEEAQRRIDEVLENSEKADRKEMSEIAMRSVAVQTEEVELKVQPSLRGGHGPTTSTDSNTRPTSRAEAQGQELVKTDSKERGPLMGQPQTSSRPVSQTEKSTKDETTSEEQIRDLKSQLHWAKTLHTRDEELLHFLQVQCQFNACSCRIAESRGERFIHDRKHTTIKKSTGREKARSATPNEETITTVKIGQLHETSECIDVEAVMQEAKQELVGEQREEMFVDRRLESTEASQQMLNEAHAPELDQSPEPTALLEDMTQVLVQPVPLAGAKTFSFSTSTSSNHQTVGGVFSVSVPIVRSDSSAQEGVSDQEHGLFDLSPPKHVPARPSTALGVSSTTKSRTQHLQSPIRVVPNSPKTTAVPKRPATAMGSFTPPSLTRKIPLKNGDSNTFLKRSGQRPAAATAHQYRSPTPAVISASASPSFPVTPIVHPPISRPRPQSVHASASAADIEMTTTTMIPLRGLDSDDIFSPAPRTPATSSRTVPLTTHSSLSGGDAQMVPGTPVNRQEALRQIRERRDRARSVHLKSSASVGNLKSAPGSVKRGIQIGRLPLGRDGERGRQMDREFSYASAPGGL